MAKQWHLIPATVAIALLVLQVADLSGSMDKASWVIAVCCAALAAQSAITRQWVLIVLFIGVASVFTPIVTIPRYSHIYSATRVISAVIILIGFLLSLKKTKEDSKVVNKG